MATYLVEAFCTESLVVQILESIVILTGLIITVVTTFTGHQSIQKTPLHVVYKYMFYACMALAILSFICFAFTACICHTTVSTQYTYVSTLTSFTLYGIMISHLYLSWLLRLYLVFNKSIYAKPNIFYQINGAVFVLIISNAICGVILYNLSVKIIGSVLVAISGFMYFFTSLLILHSFQRQLLKLITNRIVTMRAQSKESLRERTSTIGLTTKDQTLVRCMAKYITLGCTSFSTTLLVLVAMLLLFLNIFGYDYMNNIMFHILRVLIMIDVICNVLCIYLQFGFANAIYIKTCGGIDKYIKKGIESKAESILRRGAFSFYSKKFASPASATNLDRDTETKGITKADSTSPPPVAKMSTVEFGSLLNFKKANVDLKEMVPQRSQEVNDSVTEDSSKHVDADKKTNVIVS